MLDTIKLAWQILSRPDFAELEAIGWRCKYDQFSGKVKSLFFHENKGTGVPYLSFYTAPNGDLYLTVNVSLPAFIYSSNVWLPNQEEVDRGLKNLTNYVIEKSGIYVELEAAKVWSVHFTRDRDIDEMIMHESLERLSKMQISGLSKGRYRGSTIYFHSRGARNDEKKVPRTICIYAKMAECMAKKRSQAEIDAANGKLRIEYRYKNRDSVLRLLARCPPNHQAGEVARLLNQEVSDSVLNPIEKQMSALLGNPTSIEPMFELVKRFGKQRARTLFTFIGCLEKYGVGFFKIAELGFSRSAYYSCLRDCRTVGIFTLSQSSQIMLTTPSEPSDSCLTPYNNNCATQ